MKQRLEALRQDIVNWGMHYRIPRLVQWAKSLNYDGLIQCYMLSFSERILLEMVTTPEKDMPALDELESIKIIGNEPTHKVTDGAHRTVPFRKD